MTNADLNIVLVGIGLFSVFIFLFVIIVIAAAIISINSCFKDFVDLYCKQLKERENNGKNSISSESRPDRPEE